jgi:hypothetical protein
MVKQSDWERKLTMLRKIHIIFGAVSLVAILSLGALAQSQNCACGQGDGICANVDLTKTVALTGTVVSVHMGRGMGFPSFTLQAGNKEVTVVASPYRILMAANYTIEVGNQMSVVAYPSTNDTGAYLAVDLTNSTTGAAITLRDAGGVPAGAGGMRGRGMGGMRGMGGNCPMRNAAN